MQSIDKPMFTESEKTFPNFSSGLAWHLFQQVDLYIANPTQGNQLEAEAAWRNLTRAARMEQNYPQLAAIADQVIVPLELLMSFLLADRYKASVPILKHLIQAAKAAVTDQELEDRLKQGGLHDPNEIINTTLEDFLCEADGPQKHLATINQQLRELGFFALYEDQILGGPSDLGRFYE